MADNDDQFRGETLDLLLEFMDEDMLDEALQEDLSVAVTEVCYKVIRLERSIHLTFLFEN